MTLLPASMAGTVETYAQLRENGLTIRLGTVSRLDPQFRFLMVRIGDAAVGTPANWVSSYTPLLGDVVVLSGQDGAWTVLGSFGSAIEPVTAVPNPSFNLGAIDALPPHWQLVTTSGTPAATTVVWGRDDRIDGPQVVQLHTGGTSPSACEFVSSPIPVIPGEEWMGAGYLATTSAFSVSNVATVQLWMSFYSDQTLGSLVSQRSSGTYALMRGMDWWLLRNQGDISGVMVPLNATWLRLKFAFNFSTLVAASAVYLDRIIARRVI